MCLTGQTSPIVASVRNDDNWSRKLFQSYLEVGNYLPDKFSTGQSITEFDSAIFRYIKSTDMTSQHCADNLFAKSCEAADVRDKETVHGVFLEELDLSIGYSLIHHRAQSLSRFERDRF